LSNAEEHNETVMKNTSMGKFDGFEELFSNEEEDDAASDF
jgi:hypothetical protein